MNTLSIAGVTDVGRRRTDNQDTFICTTLWSESSALLAVIDGVGGYAGGERAAAIAKESIVQYMTTPNGDPLSMLREAAVFANNQIDAQRRQTHQLDQMCCVLTAAVADSKSGTLYFVHVGDTRLYRYRQGALEKLTHDHSAVGALEDANELTETEAMRHPRRNEILREVGLTSHRVDDPDFLESGQTDFQVEDQFLLCSDGLTDMITQSQIRGVLGQSLTLDATITELIRLANEQGGKDNITVVLARNSLPDAGLSAPRARSTQSVLPQSHASVPAAGGISPTPTKRRIGALWPALLGFVVGGLAVFAWYQYELPGRSAQVHTDSLLTSGQSGTAGTFMQRDTRLDSLLRVAYQSQDHRLVLPADTFWLDTPLLLSDSLKSIVGDRGLTVLMPTDTIRNQAALRATSSGTVLLENLVIKGFEKNIDLLPNAAIKLINVYFTPVDFRVDTLIRQNTFRDTLVRGTYKSRRSVSGRKPIE